MRLYALAILTPLLVLALYLAGLRLLDTVATAATVHRKNRLTIAQAKRVARYYGREQQIDGFRVIRAHRHSRSQVRCTVESSAPDYISLTRRPVRWNLTVKREGHRYYVNPGDRGVIDLDAMADPWERVL